MDKTYLDQLCLTDDQLAQFERLAADLATFENPLITGREVLDLINADYAAMAAWLSEMDK